MKNNSNNQNSIFDTTNIKSKIKEYSVQGASIMLVVQFIKLLLQTVSNVFLARMLTPNDFGLVAMVSVVLTLMIVFKDIGLSQATIQKTEINHDQISTLFWINVSISFFIMVITFFLAPLIVRFYQEPRLQAITFVLAIGLFIGGITVQHQALLRRQMRFKEIAIIELGSIFSGVLFGILFAWMGYGYWALIIQQMTYGVVTLIGVCIFTGWRPGAPRRNTGVRTMMSFGWYMTISGLITYFARNLDTILIGWRYGADTIGLYSKSYSFLLLPIGQITAPFSSISIPALSRLQNEPEKYKSYYFKVVKIIAYASMPLIVVMAVLSYEIILFVFGEQWTSAAVLFQILAGAAFWQPVASTAGWIYVSLGHVKRMMKWTFWGNLVLITSFTIGLRWGAKGVAWGYSISMWIIIIPLFLYAFRNTFLNIRSLVMALVYPLIFSFIIGAGAYFIHQVMHIYSPIIRLVVTLLGCSFITIFSLLISRSFRDDVLNIYYSLKCNIGKK